MPLDTSHVQWVKTTERFSLPKNLRYLTRPKPPSTTLLDRYWLVVASIRCWRLYLSSICTHWHILCPACNNNKLPQGQEHMKTTFLTGSKRPTTQQRYQQNIRREGSGSFLLEEARTQNNTTPSSWILSKSHGKLKTRSPSTIELIS